MSIAVSVLRELLPAHSCDRQADQDQGGAAGLHARLVGAPDVIVMGSVLVIHGDDGDLGVDDGGEAEGAEAVPPVSGR